MPDWDLDEVFDEDYLRFYGAVLTPEATARQCDLILRILSPPAGVRLIDLCCGHGRHARELAARGYRVAGIDLSAFFLSLAARDLPAKAGVVRASALALPIREGAADAAFAWFSSIGYGSEEEDLRIFREARRALRRGGRFAVEMNAGENIREAGMFETSAEIPEGRMRDRIRYDSAQGRTFTERSFEGTGRPPRRVRFSVRLYRAEELGEMVRCAGFAGVEAFSETGEAFRIGGKRLVVRGERG